MFNGIVLINKPVGWTSFDVVAKIRGIVSSGQQQRVKVGHSGTLDPFASGLLIIFLGSYTKRAQEFTKLDKTYDVTLKLGEHSTTGDQEGKISMVSRLEPSQSELEAALVKLTGQQMQRPPIYSAIKINGQRSYDLARQGKFIKLEPRAITVFENLLLSYNYPTVRFTSHVSSGTYIRSLVEDIGAALGVGAYTTDLQRTRIENYDIKDAISVLKCSSTEIAKRLLNPAENKN
jgi:tRNA pseudouridine55 synthase